MEYEVDGCRPRGLGERLRIKICQARKLNRDDAIDGSRWKKLIKVG